MLFHESSHLIVEHTEQNCRPVPRNVSINKSNQILIVNCGTMVGIGDSGLLSHDVPESCRGIDFWPISLHHQNQSFFRIQEIKCAAIAVQ